MHVKQAILQAAMGLLKEQGVAALTQPRVAGAAGVKQSHLTYYFPKRSDLLFGIAEFAIESVMAEVASRMQGRAPSRALGESIAAAMIGGIPSRVMLGLIVAADSEPALRPLLRKLVRQVRKRIGAVLDRAGLARDADSALMFHAAMVGLAVMHEAQRSTRSARELKVGVARMLKLLGASALPVEATR